MVLFPPSPGLGRPFEKGLAGGVFGGWLRRLLRACGGYIAEQTMGTRKEPC